MAADLKRIVENNKILNSQNSDWRSYFQDLADFILPRKAWITTVKSKGERLQFNYLYDSTAIRSARTAAAGFHSNLTNPSSKWFGLETRNKMVMKNHSIQKFFYDSRDAVLGALNNTNFDTSMQEASRGSHFGPLRGGLCVQLRKGRVRARLYALWDSTRAGDNTGHTGVRDRAENQPPFSVSNISKLPNTQLCVGFCFIHSHCLVLEA